MKKKTLILGAGLLLLGLIAVHSDASTDVPIVPLSVSEDGHFVNEAGESVRFWGVNLVALYPTRAQADVLAAELAKRQVNLARPHHMLRSSKDWVWGISGNSLLKYSKDSRELDLEAMDRFDYLNAKLREQGIYLALSAHFSRNFHLGDVSILETTEADALAWSEGLAELNGWDWKKSIDLNKLMPVLDERCALVADEFLRNLLQHENPYTGISYLDDPQVLTMEALNESSFEYAIISQNRFPDYFQTKLVAKWDAFCSASGHEVTDLYLAAGEMKEVRARFLRQLDQDYFERVKRLLTSIGSTVPLTYSNLWRGDNTAQMHWELADWVENHSYSDSRMANGYADGISGVARSALLNKPFVIGELNLEAWADNIELQKPYRTMLQAGMVAYGLLQDWDGLVWFSWNHGDRAIGADGFAKDPNRDEHFGDLIRDNMMQDHMRSLGYVFRNELIQPSVSPITVWINEPLTAGDYHGLLRGKNQYKAGWQNIHGVRKAYGEEPVGQSQSPWFLASPENPLVSDTGEIVKDITRRYIAVSAPQVEVFTGTVDAEEPVGLKSLSVVDAGDFVTVVLVALDAKPIRESGHLLLSRTALAADLSETTGEIYLRQMMQPEGGMTWQMQVTRSVSMQVVEDEPLEISADGTIVLPATNWTECELVLR